MKVDAWRIFKRQHAASAFSGEGARLYGGRWNSVGVGVVYAASSCALAALEMLVQLKNQLKVEEYLRVVMSFDNKLVIAIDPATLPQNWSADPAPLTLQAIGDKWVADGASAVLQVPSAVIDVDYNYLFNPAHPDFAKIAIGESRPFSFDPRLVK
ncbi:MAG TPA: RES domain-containing protein [Gemmataceae bacterium]|nr:RES domain-containing protein [Gemmataceae bacterium]